MVPYKNRHLSGGLRHLLSTQWYLNAPTKYQPPLHSWKDTLPETNIEPENDGFPIGISEIPRGPPISRYELEMFQEMSRDGSDRINGLGVLFHSPPCLEKHFVATFKCVEMSFLSGWENVKMCCSTSTYTVFVILGNHFCHHKTPETLSVCQWN